MSKTTTSCIKKLENCFSLFINQGIRGTSIEQIVKKSSLSKKELYEEFENKEGIVKSVFEQDILKTQQLFQQAKVESSDAIDEVLKVHKYLMNRYSKVNPVLFFDLKKYYSSIETGIRERKDALNMEFIKSNITRGINEKLYRDTFNDDIVAKLWISKLEMIKEQRWFPIKEYNLNNLTKEFTELHLRSIASEKGIQLLNHHYYLTETTIK